MPTGESYDFGPVELLAADAVGATGQRRFRILIRSETSTACLWLEKEQLQALAVAVEQLLGRLKGRHPMIGIASATPPAFAPTPFPAQAQVEFQVGQLGLDYDRADEQVVLLATGAEAEGSRSVTFRCHASQRQAEEFSKRAIALCSAGRPRCPYCGAPVGGEAHTCPGSNGHTRRR